MTHESVVTFLKDVSKSLSDQVKFDYGSFDDFNSITQKSYPWIWLYPLNGEFVASENKISSHIKWDIQLDFLDKDNPRGSQFDTAQTWDRSFDLMEKFIHKLDEKVLGGEDDIDDIQSNNIVIDSATFEPARKVTGDVITGWQLKLSVTTSTDFNYCSLYED